MPRYALKIEYDGRPFHGWQRQDGLDSVQGAVEAALAKVQKDPVTIAAAGRTDSGVHALGQVAHCDMQRDWDPFRLSEALNFHLKPQAVAIVDCAHATDDWHARFSATQRRYMFRLISRRAPLIHDQGRAWRVGHALEIEPMREAAAYLIGRHDFSTFRAAECQAKSPVKTMDEVRIECADYPHGQEFRFHLRARSFLHKQVRSIVGTLERVGAGAWTVDQFKAALEAADRAACGPVCPGDGLYLTGVSYEDDPFAQP